MTRFLCSSSLISTQHPSRIWYDSTLLFLIIWGRIQKFPDWVDNEINNDNNNNNNNNDDDDKHSLRSNTKGYGGKTH
jgi:hypothetical protein